MNTTPAPWSIEFIGDNAAQIEPNGYLLRFGGCSDTYDKTDLANARLMVASPALFKACQESLKVLTRGGNKVALINTLRKALQQAEQ